MMSFMKKIQEKEKARQQEALREGNVRTPEGREAVTKDEVSRKILVVGKGETLDAEAIDYAVNLAERLGYDIIALSVNPTLGSKGRVFSPYKQLLREKFTQKAKAAGESLQKKLALKGINVEQLVKFGDVGQAVAEVNRQMKRIEFVITQDGVKETEVSGEINLPVFSITGYQGERTMAKAADSSRTKMIGKTVGLGLAAAALYAAVFLNTDTVMKYFTKGAWYAALPVATVFIFSFVHGAFASQFWSLMGIEATKKAQPRPTAAKRPVARKRPRPQLRIDT
ncbi:MAG: universal stress protein [Syntrophales bacterium]|nr:universal stress protein [Syntrophales bacterium]